eukprot:SAG11_NODE_3256_length_2576_cov_1.271296_2_plen_170_part_00
MFPLCQKSAAPAPSAPAASTSWDAKMPMCSDGSDPFAGHPGHPHCADGGNFVVLPSPNTATGGDAICKQRGFAGLASLHSGSDIRRAADACKLVAEQQMDVGQGGDYGQNGGLGVKGLPHGCWIGLNSRAQRSDGGEAAAFSWMVSSAHRLRGSPIPIRRPSRCISVWT